MNVFLSICNQILLSNIWRISIINLAAASSRLPNYSFTIITLQLLMTDARVAVVTKSPAPKIEPIAILIPPSESLPATTAVITSGAPFPSARSVTPATVSDKWNTLESFAREGDK